ncbi:hypothetical protein V1512DRAFT_282109 [Lipomyces arxii]|uniref:uncharacterized protein n=1 Tax=Lipomyces arxii TaxID=56418 RepID=UPI0034CE789E
MLKQPASLAVSDGSGAANDNTALSSSKASLPPTINPGKQSQTLCRNILIHGFCKYENAGCIFRHDTPGSKLAPKAELPKKRLNVESPSFMPGSSATASTTATTKGSPLSAHAADSAIFIPRMSTSVTPTPIVTKNSSFNSSAGDMYASKQSVSNQYPQSFNSMTPIASPLMDQIQQPIATPTYDYNQMTPYSQPTPDMYYQQAQPMHYQPLNYHLYAEMPPHKVHLLPYQKTVQGFFLSDNLREELQRKEEASLQVLPNSALPEALDVYYTLVPLDTNAERSSRTFGYSTWVYKAFSKTDGIAYALRRLEGFRLRDEKSIASVQQWRQLSNANVVTLFEAFTTRAFGDNSVIFVYDYHPLSSTLFDVHFGPSARYTVRSVNGQPTSAVPEQVLWSYLVQLSSALQSIHSANLAARVWDPTKIILTSKMRIRLGAVGIMDVVCGLNNMNGQPESMAQLQQEDMYSLGRLILSIACSNQSVGPNTNVAQGVLVKSIEYVGRLYSIGLKNALIYLLSGKMTNNTDPEHARSKLIAIDEFIRLISPSYQQNFNSSLHFQDSLESELAKEVENGRLVRLMCKFNFINERPEYDHDNAWSETGDRYLLKLFRDYVFHQNDENGHPVVDLGHVLRCLNKLDAGVDEKIMLVSRDEQSCLIVSYKELKNCVDAVFRDLSRHSS